MSLKEMKACRRVWFAVFLVFAAGCTEKAAVTEPPDGIPVSNVSDEEIRLESVETAESLTPTFVSCTRLREWEDRMRWKDSKEPFTGSTVIYYGSGFGVSHYREGKEITAETGREEAREEMFPEQQEYQDAVRAYVARHGPDHDEYAFFYARHGKGSDLPVLLFGLQSLGDTTNGVMVCTKAHCLDALRTITGANPGVNYSDWAKWYHEQYKTEPPDWAPRQE